MAEEPVKIPQEQTPVNNGDTTEHANHSKEDAVDAKPAAVDANLTSPAQVDANPLPPSGGRPPGSIQPFVPTNRDSSCYDISGPKKVIIFNHRKFHSRFQLNERKGSELDVNAIDKTFKSLLWQVEVHHDATTQQIRGVMNQLQTSEETEQLSALAIFILSHGEDNGTVFANDSMYRVDHDVLFGLAADKCPYLAGKPKLIFVQACQGQNTDPGSNVRRRHTSQDSTSTYKIPNFADFLIFQASFWNHYSFRSSDTGSWFIQALCNKIRDSPTDDSILDTLLEVSRSVAIERESNVPNRPHLHQKKQTPLLYSTLLRKLYLKEGSTRRKLKNTPDSVQPTVNKRFELADHSKSGNKSDCICM